MGCNAAAAVEAQAETSVQRLQEFQQRYKVKLLWRRALRKVVKMVKHERLWRVHNAWFESSRARSAAEPAGQPALDSERMEEDRGTKRAAEPAEQQPRTRAASGLRAVAADFAPGLPMAEVVAAWRTAVELSGGPRGWQPTWHDLANVLAERSEKELARHHWHVPEPSGGQAADCRARVSRSGSPDSDFCGDSD